MVLRVGGYLCCGGVRDASAANADDFTASFSPTLEAGKDILYEYEPDVYELLDLKTGVCRMAVAAKKDFRPDTGKTLRVATKFVNTAEKFYMKKGVDIDIIRLNGSIELAPVLGLSDVIVDIVETGTTLKENDLCIVEEIFPISARLIANKSNYRFKSEQTDKLVSALGEEIKELS